MKTRTKKVIGFLLVSALLLLALGPHINSGLACLAYYEQCTAKRVTGLSKEECFAQEGFVAYLLSDKVCLVSSSE